MKRIAIIPARRNSKRIPLKNIKIFVDKPIIAFSIKAALESKIFDRVIVSTDCEDIAATSKKYGAEVPFMRSAKNSDDFASTADVLLEVLEKIECDEFCCIYATAPFTTSELISNTYSKWTEDDKQADGIFPVCEFSFPVLRSLKINENNNQLEPFFKEHYFKRSQDLPVGFHDAGQFYWSNTKAFLKKKVLLTDKTLAFQVSHRYVQDIDTLSDWEIAEDKYRRYF